MTLLREEYRYIWIVNGRCLGEKGDYEHQFNTKWTKYIGALREQHRNLPALKDELAKAKL